MPVAAAAGPDSGRSTRSLLDPERGARAADPPQRPDQPDVPDGVCELRAPGGLEVRQQIEPAAVVGMVARPATERHNTERVTAAAERPRDQVRRVDPGCRAADDAPVCRRRRAAASLSPPSTVFAAVAWFAAGLCGRAGERAGEAVISS